jgi:hypothetical protein
MNVLQPIEGTANPGTGLACRARRWPDGEIDLLDENDGKRPSYATGGAPPMTTELANDATGAPPVGISAWLAPRICDVQ